LSEAKSPGSSGGRMLPLSGSCRVGGSWTGRALIDYTEALGSPRARAALAGGSTGKARAAWPARGDGCSPCSLLTPLPAEVGGMAGMAGAGMGVLIPTSPWESHWSAGEAGPWVLGVLGSGCSPSSHAWLAFRGMLCGEAGLGQPRWC